MLLSTNKGAVVRGQNLCRCLGVLAISLAKPIRNSWKNTYPA